MLGCINGCNAHHGSCPQDWLCQPDLHAAPRPLQDIFSPKHSNRYVRVSIEEGVTPDDLLSTGGATGSKVRVPFPYGEARRRESAHTCMLLLAMRAHSKSLPNALPLGLLRPHCRRAGRGAAARRWIRW
jgi:hypothetical protein